MAFRTKSIVIAIPLTIIVIISFSMAFAGTFTCTSNVCTGSDSFTLADATNIFHFNISGMDSITLKDVGTLFSAAKIVIKDAFSMKDSIKFLSSAIHVFDKFSMADFTSALANAISTTIQVITITITKVGGQCNGQSCYVNVNAGLLESIAENLIFPALFIFGTVFGFLYMGVKFFGVAVMVATFIILGLAYIGIIPSYFTLLTIVAVGAALTKMISGMIGDNGAE